MPSAPRTRPELGVSRDPIPTPGDFRENQDPEMNELSGLGILDGSGVGRAGAASARSSQQGPEVEGNRSERGAGPGPRGLSREVGVAEITGGGWARGAILLSGGGVWALQPHLPFSVSSVTTSATASAAAATTTTAAFLAPAAL